MHCAFFKHADYHPHWSDSRLRELGELYTAVQEMERFVRAADMGDAVTINAFFRSIAYTCLLSQTVSNRMKCTCLSKRRSNLEIAWPPCDCKTR